MEFETFRFDMVWRFDIFNTDIKMMCYNNPIVNISASIFSILVFQYRVLRAILVEIIM